MAETVYLLTTKTINADEFEVETVHEFGTYQTVFDKERIEHLFGSKISEFSYFTAISYTDVESNKINGKRVYCVIEAEKVNG